MDELAWAAGFFDGEGSITRQIKRNGRDGTWTGRCSLRISIMQCDDRPLLRFAAAVGIGNVLGPYERQRGRNERAVYQWMCERERAIGVMGVLWTYLCDPKREQWLTVAGQIAVDSDRHLRSGYARHPRAMDHVSPISTG